MAAVGGPDEESRPTLRDELGWAGQSVPYNLPDPENLAEYEWLGGVPPGDADGDVVVGGARTVTDVSALIAEATQPGEEAWTNLRDAIDTGKIPKSQVQEVLSEILRTLAKGEERMSTVKKDEPILTKFLRDGKGESIEKIDVDMPGPFGETALMQAAVNGRVKHVEALLKAGANVNAQNSNGETALMWAAAYDEVEVIELLIKKKTDQKLKDNLGWTALMVAAWAGNPESVKALKSTKKEKNNDGFTASYLSGLDKAPAKTKPAEIGKSIRDTLKLGLFGSGTQRNKKGRSKTKRAGRKTR